MYSHGVSGRRVSHVNFGQRGYSGSMVGRMNWSVPKHLVGDKSIRGGLVSVVNDVRVHIGVWKATVWVAQETVGVKMGIAVLVVQETVGVKTIIAVLVEQETVGILEIMVGR